MVSFSDVLSEKKWTLPLAADVDGTLMIAWSFVILAYFLHPAIESAYHRWVFVLCCSNGRSR